MAVTPPAARGTVAADVTRTAVGNLALPAASFLTALLLARLLGTTGRGQLAAGTAPLLLMTTVATLGVPEAVTFAVARDPGHLRAAVRAAVLTMLGVGVLAGFALAALAGQVAAGDPQIRRAVVLSAVTLPAALGLAVLRAAAAGLRRWRLVNAERYATAGLQLGAVAALAAAGRLTVVLAVAVTAVAPLLGSLVYLGLRSQPVTALDASDRIARRLLGYGGRIWVGSLSGVVLSRLDQVLMVPLSGARELGLYAVAVNVADVALLASSAVRDVLFAAESASQDAARLARGARTAFLVTLVVAGVLAAVSPVFVTLAFGPSFRGSVPALLILLVGAVLVVPGSIAGVALSARGRPGLRSLSLLGAALVNVVVLLVVVPLPGPLGGAVGAALATLVGQVVLAVANTVQLQRLAGVRPRDLYLVRRSDLAALTRMVRPGAKPDEEEATCAS